MKHLLLVLLVGILLSACTGGNAESDSVLTEEPTATSEATPTSTKEPTPTSTGTSTPTPTPTPTETEEPTPSPTPEPTETPAPYQSSLTGEPMDSAPERPIAVRIDNSVSARPHTGLVDADLVYEAPTEAGVTRFLAMFQTKQPEVVGPVRSSRLIDMELIPMHDAMLAYSGASTGVQQRIWDYGLDYLLVEGNAAQAGWRDNTRYAPHNLYTSIPSLHTVSENLGAMRETEREPFVHGEAAPGGVENSGIRVPYMAGSVQFDYNSETDTYDRWMSGIEHVDAVDGRIISPKNVVVMYANFYAGDIAPNTRGERSNNADLYGSGTAFILRDGKTYEGIWQRSEHTELFQFIDATTGESIPLAEGTTWISLVPTGMAVEQVQ